ncbi:MAG: tannase/feruloyl esterase family alpha/beta hydrolase [Acidobacteria bacterium]|nr:tannase/feruloyl esterase family alpha/beta hydrolase [Acidobacteriota bacterium]
MISQFALLLALTAALQCEDLNNLSLPAVNIAAVESIPSGPYKPTAGTPQNGPSQAQMQLPAHCRVAATLTPSPDSHIEIEVWLPTETWNGKFQAVGNGGWAGAISFPAMALALREGYATASTDTGHKGGNALFGIGHPEKVVDYAYRAVHEMTVTSKAIITAFYGQKPAYSYWNGCSTGGRQGLMEAQRYPEDFDGIIAGAPANFHSHLHASDMAITVPVLKDDSKRVPAEKLALLNKAVLAACDGNDGVKDGLIQDPQKCSYDPTRLLCRGDDANDCLTAAQVETVKNVYAPTRFESGEIIFPGKAPGSEHSWIMLHGKQPSPISVGTFQLTYQDPDWDWRTFETDRDTKLADEKTGFINAVDPDLSKFKARGGKLLLYHGWDDFGIAPENTINYYSNVLKLMGPKQDDWLRLFMMPGVGHCSGGTGPDQAGFMAAMERWREAGEAPDKIMVFRTDSSARVDMTRPLCPYPQVAGYKGVGSTNDAASFECRLPAEERR